MKPRPMPRFGPAGKPVGFKGPMEDVPRYLREKGLDAFEYQAVRGVKIAEEAARSLGENAGRNDVWLTLHGPYFINLAGADDVVKASEQRLLDSLRASQRMGAHQVIFHPGYYGDKTPAEALKSCVDSLRRVVHQASSSGLKKVLLGPETTGKGSQVGSLDEIIQICQNVEQTSPTVDWAHLHARGGGAIKTKDDYAKILEKIEKELGSQTVKNLHCHFTPVEYTSKGEACHHTMDEGKFGPDFRLLAKLIVELGLTPNIISETPALDVDALKMKAIVNEEMKSVKFPV